MCSGNYFYSLLVRWAVPPHLMHWYSFELIVASARRDHLLIFLSSVSSNSHEHFLQLASTSNMFSCPVDWVVSFFCDLNFWNRSLSSHNSKTFYKIKWTHSKNFTSLIRDAFSIIRLICSDGLLAIDFRKLRGVNETSMLILGRRFFGLLSDSSSVFGCMWLSFCDHNFRGFATHFFIDPNLLDPDTDDCGLFFVFWFLSLLVDRLMLESLNTSIVSFNDLLIPSIAFFAAARCVRLVMVIFDFIESDCAGATRRFAPLFFGSLEFVPLCFAWDTVRLDRLNLELPGDNTTISSMSES